MNNIHHKIPISEDFYSVQGEGPTSGTPSVFISLSGKPVGMFDYVKKMERMKYIEHLKNGASLIFIGEEPLYYQEDIVKLLSYLSQKHNVSPYIEIETGGTIIPSQDLHKWVGHYNVNPKLANSGIEINKRIKLDVLRCQEFEEKGVLKWSIVTRKDFAEMMSILSNIRYFKERKEAVWLKPGASNLEELAKNSNLVVEFCKKHGFRFTSNLQMLFINK